MIGLIASLFILQAEHADYDGRDLILNESVEMTHPLGALSAEHAVLHCLKMDLRTPFHEIELEDNVRVHAKTPSREIDLSANKARGEIDAGALFAFQRLHCEGAVEISTSDGFIAKGGSARYSAIAGQAGAIELVPEPLARSCSVFRGKDHLSARKMRFELASSQVQCEEVQGEIASGWKEGSPVSFRARHLNWQQDLVLEGEVVVEQMLSLHAERITLSLASPEGPLTSVLAEGNPRLSFPETGALFCQGPLKLDPKERLLKTDEPFRFEDERIRMEADHGRLTYREIDGELAPDAVYCGGRVRLISSCIQDQESFALADQLVYFPETRTILLSSQKPSRVLFWQEDGALSLSAPEIQVRFDPKTKRESVQGVGDVRFAFDLQEQNLIETLFSKFL